MRRDRGIQKDNTIGMVVVVVKLRKLLRNTMLAAPYRHMYRYLPVTDPSQSLCNFDLLPFQFIAKEASSIQEKISTSRINHQSLRVVRKAPRATCNIAMQAHKYISTLLLLANLSRDSIPSTCIHAPKTQTKEHSS